MDEDILVRPFVEADTAFVLNSWVTSFREAHVSGVLPWFVYQRIHRDLFLKVIQDRAKVFVAVHPEDPDYIFGYLVTEEWKHPIVHWAYVKGARDMEVSYRRKGILTRLLFEAGVDPARRLTIVTCWTPDVSHLNAHLRSKGTPWQLKHDPDFMRDPRHKEKLDDRERSPQDRRRRPPQAAPPAAGRASELEPQHPDLPPREGARGPVRVA